MKSLNSIDGCLPHSPTLPMAVQDERAYSLEWEINIRGPTDGVTRNQGRQIIKPKIFLERNHHRIHQLDNIRELQREQRRIIESIQLNDSTKLFNDHWTLPINPIMLVTGYYYIVRTILQRRRVKDHSRIQPSTKPWRAKFNHPQPVVRHFLLHEICLKRAVEVLRYHLSSNIMSQDYRINLATFSHSLKHLYLLIPISMHVFDRWNLSFINLKTGPSAPKL